MIKQINKLYFIWFLLVGLINYSYKTVKEKLYKNALPSNQDNSGDYDIKVNMKKN